MIAFTNKLLLIPILRLLSQSSIAAKHRLQQPICSKKKEFPLLRILTDHGTEYCGKVEYRDFQLYLAVNDIGIQKQKLDPRKQTGYMNDSVKQSFRNFTRSRSEKKPILLFLNYKKTWMNGSNIINMKKHIRVRCVVEGPN